MRRIGLTVIILLALMSCSPIVGDKSVDSGKGYTVITIEGCEYIQVSFAPGMTNGYYSLTHKGNCKNPIHSCATSSSPKPKDDVIMVH